MAFKCPHHTPPVRRPGTESQLYNTESEPDKCAAMCAWWSSATDRRSGNNRSY